MGRWFLAVTLLLIAVLVAFGIFVATGVIDGTALFWRIGMNVEWMKPHLETYVRGQDAEGFVARFDDELQQETKELEQRESQLQAEQAELNERAEQLDRRERELNSLADKLEAEQAQRRNVQRLAEIYTEMTAQDAARILAELEQELILDILLEMDMQDAANILIELPTNLAADLSEKLGDAS